MEQLISFIDSLSNPLLAACAVYVAKSLHDLNIKIAVIIERMESIDRRVLRLEEDESNRPKWP